MNTKFETEGAEFAYVVHLEPGRRSGEVEYIYLTPASDVPDESGDPLSPCSTDSLPGMEVLAGEPPPRITEELAGHAAADSLTSGKPKYEGFTISHYQVERAIGRGGMGDVYLARDMRLGRPVALKLLRADYQPTEDRVGRFQLEARAVCALNHPNIVTIYEVGEVDGSPFIVSEFIEGDTLRQLIPPAGMRLGHVLEIAIQIANALAFAHQFGIIHRDIKPENVMVRGDGYVKVLDFGLAKLSDALEGRDGQDASISPAPGVVMGTITYMSPEQARGHKVDARTDIFSLGIILQELVTGRKPFNGRTPDKILSAILNGEAPPIARYKPKEPAGIQRVITKSLQKDREKRYSTMTEMIRDLRDLKNEVALQSLQERRSGSLSSPPVESRMVPLRGAPEDTKTVSSGWPDHITGRQIASPSAGPIEAPRPASINDPEGNPAREPAIAASGVVVRKRVRRAANPKSGRDAASKQASRYWPAATSKGGPLRRGPTPRQYRNGAIAAGAAGLLAIVVILALSFIFRRQPLLFDQARLAKLTSTGRVVNAVISPDGQSVAYSQVESSGKQGLWLRQVEPSGALLVVVPPQDVTYPDMIFSRDGAYLYFVSKSSSPAALYRMAMLDGSLQQLAISPAGSFGLSADGRRVAYVRIEEGGERSLVVADLNTGQERKVASSKEPNTFLVNGLAWSPDDEWIACAMASPDAKRGSSESLVAINLKDGREKRLSSRPWRSIGRIAWLRERDGLILTGNPGAPGAPGVEDTDQLWHLTSQGEPRRVTNDLNRYIGLSLTADGRTIATVQIEDPQGTHVSDAVLINRLN